MRMAQFFDAIFIVKFFLLTKQYAWTNFIELVGLNFFDGKFTKHKAEE